jgi:hypothetical protein
MEITFREEDHSYWLGKKRIPGLSEILKKVGLVKDYKGVDPFYAQRGIATHLANSLHLDGKLDTASLDPQVRPFHFAFTRHLSDSGYSPQLWEKIVYSEKEGYACRIDYWGRQDGLNVLKDAKCTKSHDRGSDYQLCLQSFALAENGYPIDRMEILELHEDGSSDPYEYPVDMAIAPAILKLYRRKI